MSTQASWVRVRGPERSEVLVQSTLPKPWQVEVTFGDMLYDWMGRAPWLAISAAAHLLVFFIFMAIPWKHLGVGGPREIQATLTPEPEEYFEEPEEVVEEEVVEPPDLGEPELQEPTLLDSELDPLDFPEEVERAGADTDLLGRAMGDEVYSRVVGIGDGGGGKYGHRFGRARQVRAAGGSGTEQALVLGLEWLRRHQDPEGFWDCDGFRSRCGAIGATVCGGPGHSEHDVGVTGLALLAFLGDGNTTGEGPYREVVSRGVLWLRGCQDPDSGLIGTSSSREFVYDHAIATLALCEAYYFSKSPLLRGPAQKAVDYIVRARNPFGAWRYEVPPVGDNDTSVTGWMVFALSSAKDCGLRVDPDALAGALSWLDEVTDPVTGRVGYDGPGSLSSRTPANRHYPRERGEAMTAVGLLCRFFLGQDPDRTPVMARHAELLARVPPRWDPEGFGCDMYYWYYGTYAMFQMGGTHWNRWNHAMKDAVLGSQRQTGDEKGSWDPVGPWGHVGGRVYSTALMTLCLEVYYRYAKVLGAR